jgi:glutathione synthase/RimK-type ligase-like ATP-grasp enzyme
LAPDGTDVADFDYVYLMSWYSYVPTRRDIAFSLAVYLHNRNVPFNNEEAYYNRSSTKLSQMMLLAEEGISVPRTVFSLSKRLLLEYVAGDTELGNTTVVAKDALASRGASNYLCRSMEELEALPIGVRESQPFIIQPFIPNDGSDIRAVVMGYKIKLLIERRGTEGSHLNNTSQGGNAAIVPLETLPEQTRDDIIRTAKLLHRNVTGIDVMQSSQTGEYFVLEANALPQLATGSFVEEKMRLLAESIIETVEQE